MKRFLIPSVLIILFSTVFVIIGLLLKKEVYLISYKADNVNVIGKHILQKNRNSDEYDIVKVNNKKLKILKDVGEAYMDRFGLSKEDMQIIKDLGVDVIEGNFDICASDEDVQYLLNLCNEYDIKIIMPAGSGEAEWGYECDMEPFSEDQKPVWSSENVREWINKWKNNPAVYAWDISNEAGSVFPNPSEKNMLTKEQLQQAYSDVKSIDPAHPIMIRMNGWFFYDYEEDFFRSGNPFGKGIADIVMINAYSNVDVYFDDFVQVVVSRAVKNITEIDNNISIIISLGIWGEEPLWKRPSMQNLQREINMVESYQNLLGIAFFKYGAKNSEWYLPDETLGAPELLGAINEK